MHLGEDNSSVVMSVVNSLLITNKLIIPVKWTTLYLHVNTLSDLTGKVVLDLKIENHNSMIKRGGPLGFLQV